MKLWKINKPNARRLRIRWLCFPYVVGIRKLRWQRLVIETSLVAVGYRSSINYMLENFVRSRQANKRIIMWTRTRATCIVLIRSKPEIGVIHKAFGVPWNQWLLFISLSTGLSARISRHGYPDRNRRVPREGTCSHGTLFLVEETCQLPTDMWLWARVDLSPRVNTR